MTHFPASFPCRRTLTGLAALTLMTFAPSAAHAMAGPTGAPGTTAVSSGPGGSYTFSDPNAVYQGQMGGPAPAPTTASPTTVGGMGGDGAAATVDATGDDGTIIVEAGTFIGGQGGPGVAGSIGGGIGGNAISFTSSPTQYLSATVSGGVFQAGQSGINPGSGTNIGAPGYDFYIVGTDVTAVGNFTSGTFHDNTTNTNIPFNGSGAQMIPDPYSGDTITGSFTGTLQNNSSPATYTFELLNNTNDGAGSLTLDSESTPSPAPEPAQTATLGLCVFGLGGLIVAARRKKAQPTA